MTDKETTELIYELLDEKFAQTRRYAAIRELRCGTGYSGLNQRSIDYLVISTNAGNMVEIFEIKASRSDFLKDIKKEEKQKQARCFADRFYYVAPKGVVKDGELPAWAGLWELYFDVDKKPYLGLKISAPSLKTTGPTWGLVASIIRHNNAAKVDLLFKEEKMLIKDNYERKLYTLSCERNQYKRTCEYLKEQLECVKNACKN